MLDLNALAEAYIKVTKLKDGVDRKEFEMEVRNIVRSLNEVYANQKPHEKGETIAISPRSLKTAAIFFDRVWVPAEPGLAVPHEIGLSSGTDLEFLSDFGVVADKYGEAWVGDVAQLLNRPDIMKSFGLGDFSKALSIAFLAERGLVATPMFTSSTDRDREYQRGSSDVIVAAIDNLNIIDEKQLTWKQVQQLRQDRDANLKLRRMRHWFDEALSGKTVSEISDTLAVKLDDYDWALKKHGINTMTGAISDLLEPRFFSAAAAAIGGVAVLAGGPWAAIGAAGLVLARGTVSLTNRLVDLSDRRRGQGSEVAFVHELKKLAPKT